MKKNLKHIKCTIKNLFDAIELMYQITIPPNKYFVINDNIIQIQNENLEWCNITQLIKKEDTIVTIQTNKNTILKAGSTHKLIIDKDSVLQQDCSMQNLNIDNIIKKSDGTKEKIIYIDKSRKIKFVYDFTVNSKKSWYITANNLIHHNTVGIGKSYTVLDELRQEQKEFIHITGGIKDSKAFYITLCKHNRPDLILVLDDVNDIIRRRQNVEILRAAVTNEPERPIAYFESKLLIDGIKSYHPRTVFKSKIIIVTNIPKSKIDPAIVSRTSPIEIIANKYDMAPYIHDNLENAPPNNVPIAWKKEAWNYIVKEIGLKNIKHLDFRVFEDVLLWKAASMTEKNSDPNAWKKFAYSILC